MGNIKAAFKTGGTTTGEDLAKIMFDQSKAIGEVNKTSLEDASKAKGITSWTYKQGDKTVIVNAYFDVEGSFEITLNK